MTEKTYDVLFAGELIDGFDAHSVKQKAAQLFKLDEQKIHMLFQGKRVSLKKNVNHAGAEKYQKVLTQIGMVVWLQPHGQAASQAKTSANSNDQHDPQTATNPASKPAPAKPMAEQESEARPKPTRKTTPEITIPDWTLDEVGAVLGEQKQQTVAVITAPEYTLAPQPCNILTPEEMPNTVAPPKLPAVEGMSLSQVGDDLLSATEKKPLPESTINVEHLAVAEGGGDLLKPNEKKAVVENNIDSSAITLSDE